MSSTVFDFLRVPRARLAALPAGPLKRWSAMGLLAFVGLGLHAGMRGADLPEEAQGTLVFVSDRSGIDSLYVRRLPDGRERRLVALDEPVRDPALSPDGGRVAFSVGGRLAVADVESGSIRILTPGSAFRDSWPAWRPDGRAIVVASAGTETANHDLHELEIGGGSPRRRALTDTPYLDETQPVVSQDGFIVFVREDHLFRLDPGGLRPRRITGGFRKARSPRFLPDGRILFSWTEGKEYGVDVVDADGKTRQTWTRGTAFYRTVVPSPDGRYLAATFTFDLAFHSWEMLLPRQHEKLQLLDVHGVPVASLATSWRYANHTADWGR